MAILLCWEREESGSSSALLRGNSISVSREARPILLWGAGLVLGAGIVVAYLSCKYLFLRELNKSQHISRARRFAG